MPDPVSDRPAASGARPSRIGLLRDLPVEVAVIAAVAMCVAVGFGIVAPAIPIYASTFGVSAFLTSAVVSVFALMRLVSAPVAGWWIERAGERRILTSGLLLVAGSSVLAGLAQTYPQLLVLRGLGGIGSSMFTVSAMALMLRVVRPDQRGRAASAFQAGFLLGGIAGPAIGGLILAWSVRAPFFIYAAALLVAALVAWRALPATAPTRTSGQEQPAEPPSTPLADALRTSSYRAALLGNLTQGFVTFGLRFSLVPLFIVAGLGGGGGLAAAGFFLAAAAQALSLLPAGTITDRRGRRPALLLGSATMLVGLVGLSLADAPWLFLLAMAVSGVGTAFLGSAPAAIAGDVAGTGGRGRVIAVFQMTADLGAIAGPLIAGLLADLLGFGPAFAVGAVVAAIALLAAARMSETLGRDPISR